MKTALFIFILAVGGCTRPDYQYVEAINASLEVMLSHHIEYIQTDPTLTDDEKAGMIKSVQEALKLSRIALERYKKNE